jgi:hypothetical protein
MRVNPTVTASAMIARFNCGRKVRCHSGVVEIVGRGDVLSGSRPRWNHFKALRCCRASLDPHRSWGLARPFLPF